MTHASSEIEIRNYGYLKDIKHQLATISLNKKTCQRFNDKTSELVCQYIVKISKKRTIQTINSIHTATILSNL